MWGNPYFSTGQNLLKKILKINIDPINWEIYWKKILRKDKYIDTTNWEKLFDRSADHK